MDAGGRPGGPTIAEVQARKGTGTGPPAQDAWQSVWNETEHMVRKYLRAPRRTDPGGAGSFETFSDTSDMTVDRTTAAVMMRAYADRNLVRSEVIKDIFNRETEDTIAYAPETFLYTAGELADGTLSHTVGESLHWLASQYGPDYVAPWLQSFYITSDVSAAKTRALLLEIAGSNIDPRSDTPVAARTTGTSQDLLQQVIEAPDPMARFRQLSPQNQLNVSRLAAEISASGERALQEGEQDLSTALTVYSTGRYGLVLSPTEQVALDALVAEIPKIPAGETTDLNDRADTLASIGVDQVRAIENGVIVLDREWAENNPADFAGVVSYLEQRHPDVAIQVGREGVVGTVLNLIGEPADKVASLAGVLTRQASELVERVGWDEGRNAAMLAEADQLQGRLQAGEVPEDQVSDTMHEIARLREDATDTFGWEGIKADWDRANRSHIQGGGFGELFAESLGLMPGDSGYGATTATATLVGQIVFDPINYIVPFARGVALARRLPLTVLDGIPDVADVARSIRASEVMMADIRLSNRAAKLADAAVNRLAQSFVDNAAKLISSGGIPAEVQGILTKRFYSWFAKTPDAFQGTRAYRQATESLLAYREAVGAESFQAILRRAEIGENSARRIAGASSRASMHLVVGQQLVGWGEHGPDVVRISDKINDLDHQIRAVSETLAKPRYDVDVLGHVVKDNRPAQAAARAIETDLRADRAWLRDILRPADSMGTGLGLPPKRVLNRIRQLTRAEQANAVDDVIEAATDTRHARLYFRLNHLWRQSGLGREITLTGPQATASIEHMQEFMRYMRIPEARITELLGPWLRGELRQPQQMFDWWDTTWRATINESTTLDEAGKAALADWYSSYTGPRSSSWVDVPGRVSPEPAVPIDPGPGRSAWGAPGWEQDEISDFARRIPNGRAMRSFQTVLGRTLNRLEAAGGTQRRLSSVVHGIGNGWYAFNNLWRTYTLMGRMGGALPLRIFGEQQVRMAAFGYASLLWHPEDYFRALGRFAGHRGAAFEAFLSSPEDWLGAILDDASIWVRRAGTAGPILKNGDPGYYLALSRRMQQISDSPSLRARFLPALADPTDWNTLDVAKVEEATRQPRFARFLERLEDPHARIDGVQDGLQRQWNEVVQLLGVTDDDDIRTFLQIAMRRGRAKWGGERVLNEAGEEVFTGGRTYRVGTRDFADLLEDFAQRGQWQPRLTWVSPNAAVYLPTDGHGGLQQMVDTVFRTVYTKPDLALSRSNLYRQVAKRQFDTLMSLGYPAGEAYEIAKVRGAARVADIMFELGVHTPSETLLRNLNPFFPAWRELFTTWLIRIPTRLGGAETAGLAWALGATALTRRVQAGMEFMFNMGAISRNDEGELVFHLGSGEIAFRSLFGIFPVPVDILNGDLTWDERLQGILPTLGAPATAALGLAEDLLGDQDEIAKALKELEHWVAPYGTDASLGPASVDALMEAYGLPLIAGSGTSREFHRILHVSTQIDGMRLWASEHPRPELPEGYENWTDEDKDDWTRRFLAPWLADMIAGGEAYARSEYLRKAWQGAVLPFTWRRTSEGAEEVEQLWADLALIRDMPDAGPLFGRIVNEFIEENPELEAFLTGKYIDDRETVSADETIETLFKGVQDGTVGIRSPADWGAFMYARASIDFAERRISREEDRLRERYGRENFADYLLDPDADATVAKLQRDLENFKDYISTQESLGPGQSMTAHEMIERYEHMKDVRYGREPSPLTVKEERLLQLSQGLEEFDTLVKLDPENDAYYGKLDEIYRKLEDNSSDDWFDRARTYFFTKIVGPYFDRQHAIYQKADDAAEPDKWRFYDEVRHLAERSEVRQTHDGIEFPGPEEYQWARLDDDEKWDRKAKWAVMPAEWLTSFQRQQVGYDIANPEAANRWADYSSERWQEYYRKEETTDEAQGRRDGDIRDRAQQLGLGTFLHEASQPVYVRVGKALGITDQPGYRELSNLATSARAYLIGADYTPSGGSGEAKVVYDQYVKRARKFIEADPELEGILVRLEDVYDQQDADLLRYLFFEYDTRSSDVNLARLEIAV